jgi:hypothetical protein
MEEGNLGREPDLLSPETGKEVMSLRSGTQSSSGSTGNNNNNNHKITWLLVPLKKKNCNNVFSFPSSELVMIPGFF